MFRFLLRSLGLVALAGGFVALIADGIRYIADGTWQLTPLGKIAFDILREKFLLLQPATERHLHPFFWQYLLQPIFETPAFIVLFVLSALLLWAGRRRKTPVGHAASGWG
jgi:hypothetical protein